MRRSNGMKMFLVDKLMEEIVAEVARCFLNRKFTLARKHFCIEFLTVKFSENFLLPYVRIQCIKTLKKEIGRMK